jgi:hypothetical protein
MTEGSPLTNTDPSVSSTEKLCSIHLPYLRQGRTKSGCSSLEHSSSNVYGFDQCAVRAGADVGGDHGAALQHGEFLDP